ncbi:hypothetical protein Taro_003625, partial [Colocasia esculenta]|nr:hypothetical protein [Colocasia esculenta]
LRELPTCPGFSDAPTPRSPLAIAQNALAGAVLSLICDRGAGGGVQECVKIQRPGSGGDLPQAGEFVPYPVARRVNSSHSVMMEGDVEAVGLGAYPDRPRTFPSMRSKQYTPLIFRIFMGINVRVLFVLLLLCLGAMFYIGASTSPIIIFVFSIGLLSFLFSIYLTKWVLAKDEGPPEMVQISDAIRDGAEGFFRTQYGTISKMAILLALVILGIYLFRSTTPQQESSGLGRTTSAWITVAAFLLGALCSGIAGYVGMWVSVRANVRVSSAARRSAREALQVVSKCELFLLFHLSHIQIAVRAGGFSAIVVVGMAVIGVAILYATFYVLLGVGLPGSMKPESVREITDILDAVGNTTKATTKGFAIGSAALASFLLFSAYMDEVAAFAHVPFNQVDIAIPEVFVGGLLGSMLIFLFSAWACSAVGRTAQEVVKEVRRQFIERPGIMDYREKPDYGRCVAIVASASLREMIKPGALAIVSPIMIGVIFRVLGHFTDQPLLGAKVVASMLMFATVSGILMALFLNTAGGAWDNAKKFIETGALGGKGSDSHKAAVTGDTVGDPFKDTAGPSLHVLIKMLATITLVMAPVFI